MGFSSAFKGLIYSNGEFQNYGLLGCTVVWFSSTGEIEEAHMNRSVLKMEAVASSKMPVLVYRTT